MAITSAAAQMGQRRIDQVVSATEIGGDDLFPAVVITRLIFATYTGVGNHRVELVAQTGQGIDGLRAVTEIHGQNSVLAGLTL